MRSQNWNMRNYYIDVCHLTMALFLGFFISLEVILSNESLGEKIRKIGADLGLIKQKIPVIIVFVGIMGMFLVSAWNNENKVFMESFTVVFMLSVLGIVLGMIFSMIIIWLRKDYIEDCMDTRKYLFDSENSKAYLGRINECIKRSQNKYDIIEAFLLYSILYYKGELPCLLEKQESIKNYVLKYFYKNNGIKEESLEFNKCLNQFTINQQSYSIDDFYNIFPLVLDYYNKFEMLDISNKIENIPQNKEKEYKENGLIDENDSKVILMLIYVLDQYRHGDKKIRKRLLPRKLKRILKDAYRKEAYWILPCFDKNDIFNPQGIEINKYIFGDLWLNAIYKWFCIKEKEEKEKKIKFNKEVAAEVGEGVEETKDETKEETEKVSSDKPIEEIIDSFFDNNIDYIKKFTEWLNTFGDWDVFVTENHLESFCKRKFWTIYEKYKEPKLVFKKHSVEYLIPNSRKEYLKMFKKMAVQIEKRYYRFDD